MDNRNANIDVYRVGLMFGICLLHSISQGAYNFPALVRPLLWCVTGFVFISGWFGIRFSLGKLLRLYGVSLYCAITFCVLDHWICGGRGWVETIRLAWRITTGQWYLNAYAVLMCLSPILNVAIDSIAQRWHETRNIRVLLSLIAPPVACLIGWSCLIELPILRNFLPKTAGLQSYSSLMMVGVYIVARILNVTGVHYVCRLRTSSLLAIFLLGLTFLGFHHYNSPVALALAYVAFDIARNGRFRPCVLAVSRWIAPSMFSVYLLHSHEFARGYIRGFEEYLGLNWHLNSVVVYVVTAVAIFCFCLILDLLRRGFVALLYYHRRRRNGS